ncbi:hypothetical protein RCL_jg701.t1 [Rhizophagus clarus]|uniref:Uncharacterized protein n=1 Tax=Rhizophagus clarus TaxID=94130 RepID=A0A8H3LDM6_9GLOM|nr:hypothetical protein RCL_jg701.t1 [Rhizophagus clarus]
MLDRLHKSLWILDIAPLLRLITNKTVNMDCISSTAKRRPYWRILMTSRWESPLPYIAEHQTLVNLLLQRNLLKRLKITYYKSTPRYDKLCKGVLLWEISSGRSLVQDRVPDTPEDYIKIYTEL